MYFVLQAKVKIAPQQLRQLPFMIVDRDTSDEATGEEKGSSRLRRHHARPTEHRSQSPISTNDPTSNDLDSGISALEKTQYTAKRVAHSTQVAVERLALQSLAQNASSVTKSAHDIPLHFQPQTSTRSGMGKSQFTSLRKQAVNKTPTNSARCGSDDTPSTQNVTSQPLQLPSTRLDPVVSSGEMDPTSPVGGLFSDYLHQPADITCPEGCSPVEMAAYTAEKVASSTTTAVQKLSSSLTEKSSHLSSGFSGSVFPIL